MGPEPKLIAGSFIAISDLLQEKLSEAETQVEQLNDRVKGSDRAFSEIVRKLGGDEQISQALKALYLQPPDSFELATPILDELVLDQSRDDLGYIWALYAAAYGQKFEYLKSTNADKRHQNEAANIAFSAIEKSIREDPQQRNFLRSLWDPNDPNYSPNEADLRSLWNDSDQKIRFNNLLAHPSNRHDAD